MGEGKTVNAWDEWTERMRAKHGNGNGHGHGKSLAIELQRTSTGWGPYAPAVERWEGIVGRDAPKPSESALVREWMMGLPAGWVTDVPGITRNQALKALGNGVVPQQAAEALRYMLAVLNLASVA
jgi:DNA (cytosine-5)-methyltransferase 1